MLGAVKDEIAMDFVGDQDQVAFGTDLRHMRNSSADQTVPPGLCGLHKNTTLVRGVSLARKRIKIHRVAPSDLDKLYIENAPLIGGNDPAKGMIGRRKDNNLIARLAHGLKDEAKPGNDPRRWADPGRIQLQAMATLHPIGQSGSLQLPVSA